LLRISSVTEIAHTTSQNWYTYFAHVTRADARRGLAALWSYWWHLSNFHKEEINHAQEIPGHSDEYNQDPITFSFCLEGSIVILSSAQWCLW